MLIIPDYSKPFIIKANTSQFATGAVLLQEDSNGKEHSAGYLTHSLLPAECNYQVYNHEFLAILRALRKWRHYIQGSPFTTIVWTDHANLTYYRSPQRLTGWQTRWVVELMDYNIELKHKPGKTMIPADVLSRRHDHNHGREDNEEKIALPDGLFVRLVDLELQDSVTKGQEATRPLWKRSRNWKTLRLNPRNGI